jgi:hypothetical protein
MNVTPPADGMAGEFSEIMVYVSDHIKLSQEIKITSVVAEVFLFELAIEPATVAMNPGRTTKYPMTAFNMGNVEDNYRFTYKVPQGWKANFTRNDFSIMATEYNRFYLNVDVPPREMPDIYIVNVTMKSLSTSWTKDYAIELEINQHFELQAEIIDINHEVYQGQTAEYELRISNYGTGSDSVKIEELTIPQYWRIKIENNVLGLGMNGTNTTKITLITDILSEDKSYESLIRITSAGNDSISITKKITTDVDSTRKTGGLVDTDKNDSGEEKGIFGQGRPFDIMVIVAIIIVIAVFMLFAYSRRKRSVEALSEHEKERLKVEEERKQYENTYKDLYGSDAKLERRDVKSFGYVEGPPRLGGRPGGPPQSPVTVEYIAPPGAGPRPQPHPQPLPPPQVPMQRHGGSQLPLGPVPDETDTPGGPVVKKKKKKKGEIPVEGDPVLALKLPGVVRGPGKSDFDVSLPGSPSGPDAERDFAPLKPERDSDMAFEQKKPEFADSSPVEWESVSSDEYQKSFEFGSTPKTVESKKKKQNE